MKRQLFLITCLILFAIFNANAQGGNWGGQKKQPKIKGKITGQLLDSLSNQPIEFATAVLLDADFKKEINGVLTDEKGNFKIEDIPAGTYDVAFSSIGYKAFSVQKIKLTLEKPDKNLDKVFIVNESYNLDEIEVTAEASLIENKIDKIVFNAEKDATNVGGDAADVLRKVPLLSVDLEGNVTLRGSQNIRILLNGKTSGLFANSIADALKAIPADQIKKVEVITSPTAKYDGEGSAGIINIITKKKSVEGFSGSVNSSIGTRQNNLGLNINAAKGRLGFTAGGYSFFSWPRNGTLSFVREDFLDNGDIRRMEQSGEIKNNIIGYNANAGVFYDINAYNSISSNIRLNGFNSFRDGVTDVNFVDPTFAINQIYARSNAGSTLTNGFDWTSDYTKTFKKEEQEFSIGFQMNTNFSNNTDEKDQTSNDALLRLRQNNLNDGNNFEYTIQTDYVHPFSKKVKLETGAKGVLRRIDSDYSLEDFDFNANDFIINTNNSDLFKYNQDVYAAYTSFNVDITEKIGIIAGVRYENTQIDGSFASDGVPFENSYYNLLPNFIISHKLKGFSAIKASYGRRIQRPSLFYINPFTQVADDRNITFGNPDLNPEITDKYDINYNNYYKGVVINTSVYYQRTTDVIESFFTIRDDGVSETTYKNVGTNDSYGFNVFTSFSIKKIWTIRGNFDLFTYDVSGTVNGENLSRQTVNWNGFLSSSLDLKKGWKVEAFGFYRSPNLTLQGSTPTFSMFSIGASKDLWEKKASIGISIIEPFNENKSFATELEGPNFTQVSDFTIPFRSFGVKFNYRFGKLDFKQSQRKSKINNDDMKEESGGGQF